MFDLTGRRAFVTGSTQGIGYAVAECLSSHGAMVYLHCSKDWKKAERLAADLQNRTGNPVKGIAYDLAEADAAGKLYAMTGPVDILICNASVQFRCAWEEIPESEFEKQINVNLRSSLFLMQKYIPPMQKNHWGRVLNIGSVQQAKPHTHMAVYAATKCALSSLTENIAKQTAADGVTVNMLLPGVIATPRNEEALSDPVYRELTLQKIPAGYAGEPEDCASAALLLCSEEGRYITGSSLYVDGGMHL